MAGWLPVPDSGRDAYPETPDKSPTTPTDISADNYRCRSPVAGLREAAHLPGLGRSKKLRSACLTVSRERLLIGWRKPNLNAPLFGY